MTCDPTRLAALVHEGLDAGERVAMERHLAACPRCRAEERRLREQDEAVEGILAALDPAASEAAPAGAFERFRSALHTAPDGREHVGRRDGSAYSSGAPSGASIKARIRMHSNRFAQRRRPLLVAAAVAACLVTAITLAPARQLVSKFLGIFRVRQFSAVTIDREHLQKLHDLAQNLGPGIQGEAEYERKPGEPRKVSDAAEASRLAGFPVKGPASLPQGAEVTDFSVAQGPIMTYQFDRDRITAQLEAAGLSGITLPPMESGTIRVEVPAMAHLSYRVPQPSQKDTTVVELIQVANPSVTLPPGTDAEAWGELMLQILGMPADKAQRLARSIDWTSTFVIPLPANMASFQEVDINGAKGLLVEHSANEEHGRGAALLWQKDDTVYCVRGERILGSGLLEIAESLR